MTTNSVYSPLKIFHHQPRLDSIRRGGHPSPIHVQIIPTNRCQQRCSFCSYRNDGYSSNESFSSGDEIPFGKLAEIVADCEDMGVRAIEITGGGEPTCHPQFLDLCTAILDANIDLGLVTNGGLWTEAHTRALAMAKWVRFSIDAGCRETYATIRRVKPEVYDHVRDSLKAMASSKSTDDRLNGVGFVVTADNWSEVVQATERAKEDGADNIRISAVFQNEGDSYFHSFGIEAGKLCREAESLQTDSFRVFNMFTDRIGDLREGKPTFPRCGFQHLCTYLGADCNVYRCCVVSYNKIGLIGSVANQSFRSLWTSDETRNTLSDFNPAACPRCMFTNKNNTIEYALEANPAHVNFL